MDMFVLKQKIEKLFIAYQQAFKSYDVEKVKGCYQTPCTLTTADKVIVINDQSSFEKEFNEIFAQLKSASTKDFAVTKASYQKLNESLILACIDWAFINENEEVFADFSAFYHIADQQGQLSIVNVMSHPLEQSAELAYKLSISN